MADTTPQSSDFEVFELRSGSSTALITAAARTICLAFSNDPLIKWLRPGQVPWASMVSNTMAYQSRRVYENIVQARVFGIANRLDKQNRQDQSVLPAVAFVSEPSSLRQWGMRLIPRVHLWMLNKFSPVQEAGDLERMIDMMATHDKMLESIQARLQRPVTYIEVVAVDPGQQGRGLGSMMMRHVLSQCPKNTPIVLECTAEENVGFYEHFGFKVVDTKSLLSRQTSATKDQEKLWIMVKE